MQLLTPAWDTCFWRQSPNTFITLTVRRVALWTFHKILRPDQTSNRRYQLAVLPTLQWRHNERDGISNHHPHGCLLNFIQCADQRKHQSSASLAFVRGIHRWPVNSPHKGPVTQKMFPFDDVIMKYGYTWLTLCSVLLWYKAIVDYIHISITVLGHWSLHSHLGNLAIAPMPAK